MSASAQRGSPSSSDQGPHADESWKHQVTMALKDLGSLVPAIVAIGAPLAYGVLIVSYSEFYAELGVRPSDVGFEFGPGLGGIVGVAVLLILALAVVFLCLLVSHLLAPRSSSEAASARRTPVLVPLIIGGLVAVVVVAWFVNADARGAAAKVRDGKPVGPLTLRGLEVVALRADRAEVVPGDPKAVDSELYSELRERDPAKPLMYLGRSGTSLVLYDSDDDTSWQIPASMFAVQTVNCEKNVESRNPACPD